MVGRVIEVRARDVWVRAMGVLAVVMVVAMSQRVSSIFSLTGRKLPHQRTEPCSGARD